MKNRFLHLLLLLTFMSNYETASAGGCLELPNKQLEENILIEVNNYQDKYDFEKRGAPYEGLISAILDEAHICVIEILLKDYDPEYVDINASNNFGIFPLSAAAYGGNVDVIQLLLAIPEIDVNNSDHVLGITALMSASFNGHTSAVETLLQTSTDINVNAQNNMGMNALMYASERAYVGVARTLLEFPDIDVLAENMTGDTVLQTIRNTIENYYQNGLILHEDPKYEGIFLRYKQIVELLLEAEEQALLRN